LTSTESFAEIVPGEPLRHGGVKRKRGSQIASLDLSEAISRKRCKIGRKLLPKSVTLNDLERRNGLILLYFIEFGSFQDAMRKSGEDIKKEVHVRYVISYEFRADVGYFVSVTINYLIILRKTTRHSFLLQ